MTTLLVGSLLFVPQHAPDYSLWDGRTVVQESTPAPKPEHTHPPAPTPQPDSSHSHASAPTPPPEPKHTPPAEPAPEPVEEHTHEPDPDPPAPKSDGREAQVNATAARYCPPGYTVVHNAHPSTGSHGTADVWAMTIYIDTHRTTSSIGYIAGYVTAHECAHLWDYYIDGSLFPDQYEAVADCATVYWGFGSQHYTTSCSGAVEQHAREIANKV